MPEMDIFNEDAFSMHTLTDAINKVPFKPGQVGRLGLFQPHPVSTTSVDIEEEAGVLTLLPTAQRGAPSKPYKEQKRTLRSLRVPHVPHNDYILADQIQGVRAFGSESQLELVQSVVNRHIRGMADNHDVTQEHLMVGAVKGSVVDSDGSSVLYNLYTEFNVTPPTEVDFDLDNPTPAKGALRKKCHAMVRAIKAELGATPFTRVHCLCSPEFFDELVTHPEVEKAYERWNAGQLLRDGLVDKPFTIFDISFEEYVGSVNGVDFVAAQKAHFFPVNVPGLFKIYYAPADYMETVNTLGLPRYAKVAPDAKYNKFVEVETQSNPLPICTRPLVLRQGRMT